MADGADDVLEVLVQQIERRFEMALPELQEAVAVAPNANREATAIVHWHALLAEAQKALEQAEDALVAALGTHPGEVVDDPVMDLAQRVNAAVGARDGRAMVVRFLLDPDAPGKRGPGARPGDAPGVRRGPALQTSPPERPALPVRGASR